MRPLFLLAQSFGWLTFVWMVLAVTCLSFGDNPADELYRQALKLSEQGPENSAECLELLQKQIKNMPQHEPSFELLARIQIRNADFPAAKLTAKKAISIVRRKHRVAPEMMFLLARCYYETGELKNAKQQLNECRQFFERDTDQKWRFHELESSVDFQLKRHQKKSQGNIALFVTVKPKKESYKQGEPILVDVSIENQLDGVVGFSTYSLTPNDWNGETASVTLVDINRNEDRRGLFLRRPEISVPNELPGIGGHRIEPGDSLKLTIDASKWEITDGWIPGKYSPTLRADGLTVDGNRCMVGVQSPPFNFEILK